MNHYKIDALKLWTFCFYILFGIFIIYFSFQFNDTDLYFLINTGKYIITNQKIPHINPFITTSDYPLILQNWLYSVIVAWIDIHFHSLGLWTFQLLTLLSLTFLIIYFFGFFKTNNILYRINILFSSLIILFVFNYLSLRPEMMTFLLLLVEIIALEKYQRSNNIIWLFLIPITTFLEMNMHGSYYLMHFIVILPYLVRDPFKICSNQNNFTIYQIKRIIPFIFVSILVLLINPYGYKMIFYTFDFLKSKTLENVPILEMQPFSLNSIYSIVFILFTILFCFLVYQRKIDTVTFCMYLGFGILMFHAAKWIAFYAISLLFLFRICLSLLKDKLNKIIKFTYFNVFLFVLFLIYLFISFIKPNYDPTIFKNSPEYMEKKYDYYKDLVKIEEYLNKNDPNASIFAKFEDENYFEYMGYPVYYDARPDIYYSKLNNEYSIIDITSIALYGSLNKTEYDFIEYSKIVDGINCDYFVISNKSHILSNYLSSNKKTYQHILSSNDYNLYKKIR